MGTTITDLEISQVNGKLNVDNIVHLRGGERQVVRVGPQSRCIQ